MSDGYEIPSGGKTFAEGDFVFIRRRKYDGSEKRISLEELPAITYGHPVHNDRVMVFIPRRKTAEYVHLSDCRHATAADLGGDR